MENVEWMGCQIVVSENSKQAYAMGYNNGFNEGKVTPWINANIEKPKNHDRVLVFSKKYGVSIDYYGEGWGSHNQKDVTHWQQLPKPPQD